ncbi:MAG: hypothetical protein ACJ77E_08135 [Gaiellaceae bacterium]
MEVDKRFGSKRPGRLSRADIRMCARTEAVERAGVQREPLGYAASSQTSDRRDAVDAAALRKRITDKLVGDVSEAMYPSATMLNRVEAALATPDDLAEYAETLVEKVEATRFPSADMLKRLDGLVTRLEALERQQQQRRQLEVARERS